jgi:hypothetical protein
MQKRDAKIFSRDGFRTFSALDVRTAFPAFAVLVTLSARPAILAGYEVRTFLGDTQSGRHAPLP